MTYTVYFIWHRYKLKQKKTKLYQILVMTDYCIPMPPCIARKLKWWQKATIFFFQKEKNGTLKAGWQFSFCIEFHLHFLVLTCSSTVICFIKMNTINTSISHHSSLCFNHFLRHRHTFWYIKPWRYFSR